MRFLISIFLASMLIHGPANAKNDKVLRGPVPNWVAPSELMSVPENAGGLVFVRRQDVLVHLDEQGQAHYTSYRIKILHANALHIGNISIVWNPASGAPYVHFIKVHRDGEVIDVLDKASFEILRREDQLEAAKLDGTLTAVFRVSDLRVGDELEVAQTTRLNDPTLGNNDAGLLVLAAKTYPGRYKLGISWIKGQQPKMKMAPEMAVVVQKSHQAVEFRFDNPSILVPAKDAPFRYLWQRVVEYSDFSDWSAISQQFSSLYSKAAKFSSNSPLKQEVNRISTAHTSPLERAGAALKLVQQDVRYIYVGLNGGNLTPATAEETWSRRYGDCKGKTVLLMGLLAELGIEAEPVLVNSAGADDGLNERLPSLQMFDHVIVRIRINGAIYYLDGTLPPVVPPSAAPKFPYMWILPLTEQGSTIEHLEWRPSKVPDKITLYEIDARTGFNKPAKKTNTTITRGLEGLQQQIQFSGQLPSDLLNGLRQQLVGDTWQTIDDVKWRFDQKAQASVLTISGTGPIDWDDDRDGKKEVSLPGGGFSPPERRIRANDQNQDLPYSNDPEFICHVTTLRLPSETLMQHWFFNTGFDTRIFGANYYRAFALHDGSIRMIRGFRTEQQEVDAASARQDNDRIAAFDNSMARIFYNPNKTRSSSGIEKNVPTTYDIDWTADNVPCISGVIAG